MSIFNIGVSTIEAPVFEGYSHDGDGMAVAVQESFEDRLAIIEAMHQIGQEEVNYKSKLKVLESSNANDYEIETLKESYEIAMEGAFDNTIERIKKFFSNLWGKITAYFKSLVKYFDYLFKNAKDFATKYEKDLREKDGKGNLSGFEFSLYTYTNLDEASNKNIYDRVLSQGAGNINIKIANTNDEKTLKSMAQGLTTNKESMMDNARGKLLKKSSVDAADFAKELFAFFRNGAESASDKEKKSISSISEFINVLKTSNPTKVVEDNKKETDKIFKEQIDTVNKVQKELSKGYDNAEDKELAMAKIQYLNKIASHFSSVQGLCSSYFNAWKSAINERNSEYKSLLLAALRYKKKDK